MGSLVNLFWFLCKKVGPNCVAKLDYNGLKFEVIESNQNIAKKKGWIWVSFWSIFVRFFGFQNCFNIYPKFVKYWMPFSFFLGGFWSSWFFFGRCLGVSLGSLWRRLDLKTLKNWRVFKVPFWFLKLLVCFLGLFLSFLGELVQNGSQNGVQDWSRIWIKSVPKML